MRYFVKISGVETECREKSFHALSQRALVQVEHKQPWPKFERNLLFLFSLLVTFYGASVTPNPRYPGWSLPCSICIGILHSPSPDTHARTLFLSKKSTCLQYDFYILQRHIFIIPYFIRSFILLVAF